MGHAGFFDDGDVPLAPGPTQAAFDAHAVALTDAGRRLFAYLSGMTIERATGPAMPEAELRHLEGQRNLVRHIQALVRQAERGA